MLYTNPMFNTEAIDALIDEISEHGQVQDPDTIIRAMCNLSALVAKFGPQEDTRFPNQPADCICPEEDNPFWQHSGRTFAWIIDVVLSELELTGKRKRVKNVITAAETCLERDFDEYSRALLRAEILRMKYL